MLCSPFEDQGFDEITEGYEVTTYILSIDMSTGSKRKKVLKLNVYCLLFGAINHRLS